METLEAAKRLTALPVKRVSLATVSGAARTAAQAGKIEEAVKSYEAAVELAPKNAELLNSYAWWLITLEPEEKRNPERAVELARRAVDLSIGAGHIVDTLAYALYQAGELEEAVEFAEKAAKLCPEISEVVERAKKFRSEFEKKRKAPAE